MTLKELIVMYPEMDEVIIEMLDKYISIDIIAEIKSEIEKNFFTMEEATEIISNMKPYGIKWEFEELRQYMINEGIKENDLVNIWILCNMYYNDSYEVAKKYNIDIPDFYFDMAKSFLYDIDAEPFKIKKYFNR